MPMILEMNWEEDDLKMMKIRVCLLLMQLIKYRLNLYGLSIHQLPRDVTIAWFPHDKFFILTGVKKFDQMFKKTITKYPRVLRKVGSPARSNSVRDSRTNHNNFRERE